MFYGVYFGILYMHFPLIFIDLIPGWYTLIFKHRHHVVPRMEMGMRALSVFGSASLLAKYLCKLGPISC